MHTRQFYFCYDFAVVLSGDSDDFPSMSRTVTESVRRSKRQFPAREEVGAKCSSYLVQYGSSDNRCP